jgi:hypothetical protein
LERNNSRIQRQNHQGFKFIDGKVDVRTQHGSKTDQLAGRTPEQVAKTLLRELAREGRFKGRDYDRPPNKTDSVTVELLGMAYDAYPRARSSPDASTKQNLTPVADGFLKQAKEMRQRCNSNDRFSSEQISERPPRRGLSISAYCANVRF